MWGVSFDVEWQEAELSLKLARISGAAIGYMISRIYVIG